MRIVQRSREAHTSIRSTMRAVRELPAECRGPIPAAEKEVLAVIKSWLTDHGGTMDNRYRVIVLPMLLGNGVTSNALGNATRLQTAIVVYMDSLVTWRSSSTRSWRKTELV